MHCHSTQLKIIKLHGIFRYRHPTQYTQMSLWRKKGLLTKVTTLKRLFDIKHFSQKLSQIIWSFIPTYEKVFIQTSSQRWCCVYYLCRNVLMTKSHEKQTHGVGDQMAGSVGYCFTGKCTAEQIWPMSISFCSTL